MDAVDREVMRRDVYPAEVAMPDGSMLTGVRVFVTSHRFLVYRETEGRTGVGFQLALGADLAEPDAVPSQRNSQPRGVALEIALSDGTTAWVNKGRGCGCGSPLKRMGVPAPWTRRRAA